MARLQSAQTFVCDTVDDLPLPQHYPGALAYVIQDQQVHACTGKEWTAGGKDAPELPRPTGLFTPAGEPVNPPPSEEPPAEPTTTTPQDEVKKGKK